MRGSDEQPGYLFSYLSAEARVPADHPLRPLRRIVDDVLHHLSPRFERLYVRWGRPSIAPEKLLRALLLQITRADAKGLRLRARKGYYASSKP